MKLYCVNIVHKNCFQTGFLLVTNHVSTWLVQKTSEENVIVPSIKTDYIKLIIIYFRKVCVHTDRRKSFPFWSLLLIQKLQAENCKNKSWVRNDIPRYLTFFFKYLLRVEISHYFPIMVLDMVKIPHLKIIWNMSWQTWLHTGNKTVK